MSEYLAKKGTKRLQSKLEKMIGNLEKDVNVANEKIPHKKVMNALCLDFRL